MANHVTEIVGVQHVADELLAVCLRCCGDGKTDSWHTMHISVVADDQKRADSLSGAHRRVANTHKAYHAAKELLDSLKGTTVEHA